MEYVQLRSAGAPVSPHAIAAKHPELMPELAAELQKLSRIEGALDEADTSRFERAVVRLSADWTIDSVADPRGVDDGGLLGSSAGSTVEQPSTGSDGQDPLASGPIPAAIGRYRVRHLLGEGAFGRVFLAWDEQLAREVAVKVSHAGQVPQAEGIEGFLAEARTLARLDHASIVPVYDVGRTGDGRCYVVSKWIRGSDLELLMRRGRLPGPEAARIVTAVAGALHYAHQNGLIHRDVKPANILLDSSGTPYLGDFGLALSGRRLGQGRSFAGTPAYMSPEQARGEAHRVDGRSDVFSLGVVLYQAITGQKPFRGEPHEELLRQILWEEPTPPRQHNPAIAPELARICLKALSKRAADRYHTAQELADDLKHYLDGVAGVRTATGPLGGESLVLVARAAASVPNPRIVPRGLRPFDAVDSASFLPLVPGPRDREGLPESIRQWKTRIEETDPEDTFAVGVLYGPSGCGKSSLVKAGLLPRLSPHVHSVYVEAAADQTEARVLRKLARRYPQLPADGDLADCLAALRCGCGPADGSKLLFVVDQFEQWLHGRSDSDRRPLVEALRHCDGVRLQCLLLVRDDFWLALSRFMTELEIDLVQHHNSALVDLFTTPHARKVLAEFGRAFGRLPEDLSRISSPEEAFLDRAIEGLADGDRVVPVRLALFAEMVKGKPWTPATLRDVGGPAGVGVTFLEETFGTRAANPQYRLHEQAARAVLEALLPASGSDMKGRLRSYPELLDLSGYGEKPRAFKELIRILDTETRLITPGDPEVVECDVTGWHGPARSRHGSTGKPVAPDPNTGKPVALDPSSGTPVASFESTSSGGLRYYQLTHDYLVPAIRDWLTKKRRSTRSGRSELRLASRTAMWTAHPERRQLPTVWEWATISLFTRSRRWSDSQRKMMRSAARYHALTAGFLAAVLVFFLFGGLEVTGAARDLLMQLRARSAAVWMAIGNEGAVWPLLKNGPDATLRTRVIHGLSLVDTESLLDAADRQEDVSIRRAMLLVAGEQLGNLDEDWDTRADLRRNAIPPSVIDRLVKLYRDDPDPGIHAAAEWTLRQCGHQDRIARSNRELESTGPLGDRQWYVNGQGHTMIVIPGPTQFLMGPAGVDGRQHPQRIRRSFSIAAGETTIEEFRRFLNDNPEWKRDSVEAPAGRRPDLPGRVDADWPDFPQASVTWYEAAAYCNWLSREGKLPMDEWCYVPNASGEYAAGMRLADDYLDRRGYRLPTEPEWEYACRAGSTVAFSFGSDASYLEHYGVYGATSGGQPQPSSSRKPNDFGLFDMHGNVAEWCEDLFAASSAADRGASGSPPDYGVPASDSDRRVLRGGSFLDTADALRCGVRTSGPSNTRQPTVGFRVARSYP